MPVSVVTEKLDIHPRHVFIVPERHDLHVQDGTLRLKPISKAQGWADAIPVLLRSLAQHRDGKFIAVICPD